MKPQKLGKHHSVSPHAQAGQAGQWGQRRPRHHPWWSIVLTQSSLAVLILTPALPLSPSPGTTVTLTQWDWQRWNLSEDCRENKKKLSTDIVSTTRFKLEETKSRNSWAQVYLYLMKKRFLKIFQTPHSIVRLRSFPDLHHEEHQ